MVLAINQPFFIDRVSTLMERTSGQSASLKFVANTMELASSVLACSVETMNASNTCERLASTFRAMRLPLSLAERIKCFFLSSSVDSVKKYVGYLESAFYAGRDLLLPVNFIAGKADYELSDDHKKHLGRIGEVLYLAGLTTSIVLRVYDYVKVKDHLLVNQVRIHELSAVQNPVSGQKNELVSLKYECSELEEIKFRHILSIIERVADIVALVFGFAACFAAPVLFVSAMALFSVVSAGIALYKLWRDISVKEAPPQKLNIREEQNKFSADIALLQQEVMTKNQEHAKVVADLQGIESALSQFTEAENCRLLLQTLGECHNSTVVAIKGAKDALDFADLNKKVIEIQRSVGRGRARTLKSAEKRFNTATAIYREKATLFANTSLAYEAQKTEYLERLEGIRDLDEDQLKLDRNRLKVLVDQFGITIAEKQVLLAKSQAAFAINAGYLASA
ncbi:MAG: hypothetical protein P4L16_02730 [Chlamydiales bacterium]|nr:hypothetical protein [Chlamydiales bacterium]